MLIALTGGIASGKSTVAELWRELGAEIVDADEIARQVVSPESEGLSLIRTRFGDVILNPDGSLNRAALGGLVFSDEIARRDLEQLLHPLIQKESKKRFANSKARHVVYAIPLLVEKRHNYSFDKICTVSAPVEVRIDRLAKFRKMTRDDARKRISAQAADLERESIADVVIDSNCSLPELRIRAKEAWLRLTAEMGDKDGA